MTTKKKICHSRIYITKCSHFVVCSVKNLRKIICKNWGWWCNNKVEKHRKQNLVFLIIGLKNLWIRNLKWYTTIKENPNNYTNFYSDIAIISLYRNLSMFKLKFKLAVGINHYNFWIVWLFMSEVFTNREFVKRKSMKFIIEKSFNSRNLLIYLDFRK